LSSVSFDDSFITRVYTDTALTLASYDSLWKEEAFTRSVRDQIIM